MKKLVFVVLTLIMLIVSVFSFSACKEKEKVSLKYSDAPSIMQMLVDDTLDAGLLPEPVATKLEKVKGKDYTWQRLSLQDLYDEELKAYPQAVLMVKESVLEQYSFLVDEIASRFSDNVAWVKANPSLAVSAVQGKLSTTSLTPASIITSETVENCKIYWQSATDSKQSVTEYIDRMLGIELGLGITVAKQVGNDFFYESQGTQTVDVTGKTFAFYCPDGAPALSIAKFINDSEAFGTNATFDYNVVVAERINEYMNGVSELADFIILPVNSASLLHETASYKMVSVVTHGNLYLMSKQSLTIDDLVNKKIGVIGEGKVPDITFKSILKNKGIEYITVN